MTWGRYALAAVLIAAACPAGAQAPEFGLPVRIDSAAALVLKQYWTAAPNSSEDLPLHEIVCAYGAVSSDSSATVDSVARLPKCQGGAPLIGALGYVKGYYTDQERDALYDALCKLLKKQPPSLHFVGVVHGIVPVPDSGGRQRRIPLVWACWRP